MDRKKILITGASGFVGTHLGGYLANNGYLLNKAVRQSDPLLENCIAVGDIGLKTDWSSCLIDVRVVVHLAARVHAFGKQAQNFEAYRQVNVDGTVTLARQAAKAGVQRFIYLSTVKVHGEESGDYPFQPGDKPNPQDMYGTSKLEAENRLAELCAASEMELVVIRPPLLYGRGVKGNFAQLVKLVQKRYYLPLGLIRNKRSLLGIGNLCSLIEICLAHPNAPGGVLLASDGEDIATPDLVRLIAKYNHTPAKLMPVPVAFLSIVAGLIGMRSRIRKLTGNLQVDITETRNRLNWIPPYSIEQGVAAMFEV